MMQRSRNEAAESIPTADIPLRPEVIEFMDAKSLGRYTCSSATMRKDARDAKAWQLLSNVQRPAEEAFFAAERDAAAARRSQALRRRLADQLDGWRAGGYMLLDKPTTNTFANFTFFLRIDDDEGRIWEGDLAPTTQFGPQAMGVLGFDLSKIWSALKDGWDRMVAFLATGTGADDDVRDIYLHSLHLTLVAVREADQAMIALGQFSFNDALGITDEAIQEYDFRPKRQNDSNELKLFSTPQQDFRAFVRLVVTHDATGGGGGTLDSLDIGVDMTKYNAGRSELITAEDLERDQVEYLFTYLAGVDHRAREGALATIKGWDD